MATNHPQLKSAELFLDSASAPGLSAEHLRRALKSYPLAIVQFVQPKRRQAFYKIDFRNVYSAEKVLATFKGRIINVPAPITLEFLTKSPVHPPSTLQPGGAPCIIRNWGKFKSAEELFDLLRKYGPLFRVTNDPVVGALVQFWTQAATEKATAGLGAGLLLKEYSPLVVFCSNVHIDVNEAILRMHFNAVGLCIALRLTADNSLAFVPQFGDITALIILENKAGNSNNGRARITFSNESQGLSFPWNAIKGMNGRELCGQALFVSYHVPNPSSGNAAPLSPADREKVKPQPTFQFGSSNRYQMPPADESASAATAKEPEQEDSDARVAAANELDQLHTQLRLATESEARANLRCDDALAKAHTMQAELDAARSQLNATTSALSQLAARFHAQAEEMGEMRAAMEGLRARLDSAETTRSAAEEKFRAFEEANRAAEVEEMRRRMTAMAAEEQQRKAAEARERASREQEEKMRKEREEEERREAQERARLARERAEQERLARERERAHQWKTATVQAEQRCRDRDMQMRGTGPWTISKALLRLQSVMDEFERTKFSETLPLTMGAIPWPVFVDPLHLQMTDISWDAVEALFHQLQRAPNMTFPIRKALVRRAMLMFHPDSWKAKLKSVMDPDERERLEAAGNVVSQAMTGLWNELSATTK
ncbi:RRM domain-containing protein [Mycena chlorophos]|uniref:RRM domain-containing protein n=1 Tax=Mycena chlorophos TaxID=658473 RepID=A0A8H6TV94_MYCCL|nr:RRM domain-containing protein [Mycena chlorophos]